MAEELNIKVNADTGAANANLQKTEKAVAGVKKEVKGLDDAGKKSGGLGGVVEGADKATQGISKLMAVLGKATAVIGLSVAAYKTIAAAIDAWDKKQQAAAKSAEDAAVRTIKFEAALRLANKGIIDLGGSTEEMLRNYDAYIEKTQRSTTATQDATRALAEYQMALAEVAEATRAASEGMSFTIISPEDADKMLDPIRSLATGLENALKKAFEVGGAAERDAWAAANEAAVQKVIAAYEKAGLEIPEHIRAFAAARRQDVESLGSWVAEMNAATEAINAQRAALNDLDVQTSIWLQKQQQMSNVSGQSTEFMKAAEDQFRKTGQAIYTMTQISLDWTHATESQIDALRRMNEGLNETWDGSGPGQKALDAIAQLVDLFKAGVLSLDGFNKNFAYLEEQLDRVIKAGGDLDGTLSGVLDALRKIAQQVRQGPGGARPGATPGY